MITNYKIKGEKNIVSQRIHPKFTFKIQVDPMFLVLVPLMFLLGFTWEYIIIFISILMHELGHVSTAVLIGQRLLYIRLLPVGLNAVMDGQVCNRRKNVLIYMAGPVVNMILFGLCWIFVDAYMIQSEILDFFILANIYLMIFNMIPILPLDGGKVFREIISAFTGMIRADRWMRKFSMIFSVLLIILGAFQLIENCKNFSLMAAGIYILFTIKFDRMEAALMNMKSFIYRHRRLAKKGIYPSRDLVAIKTVQLDQAIKSMDFDRFHFVRVLDENLAYLCSFTEQEIINGMVKYGPDITFEDFIKKSGKR